MKGQISIDYLAGALIFFGSVVFLVSNVMTALPQFSQAQTRDDLQLAAWSMSEVVMEDRGYWENGEESGEDWHQHVENVEILGLRGNEQISREKVEALKDIGVSEIRSVLRTEKKLNIEFQEIVPVNTRHSFEQGNSPDFITKPSYDSSAPEVRYGSERLAGEELYFLLLKNPGIGWYNRLVVSQDWDFTSGADVYNLTETQYIPAGNATYIAEAANTQLSSGRLLILSKGLGRVGDVPDKSVDNIVSVERYGAMDGNLLEVRFRVWE